VTLAALLTEAFSEWTSEDLFATLPEAEVPVAPFNDTVPVWNDPQVEEREMLRHLENPEAGTVPTIGFRVKNSDIDLAIDRSPPVLGEHSQDILASAGYDEDAIEDLREQGVLE